MVKCEECDKKLGILQGHRHPALGKRFMVCRKCFCKIDEDMERWRKFYVSNSFKVESSKINVQDAWNENLSSDPVQQKWFRHLWHKLES
ncbi:hypothetical protein AYK25_08205 [Thermoplasmatales archaeon SM1-50]|nr:MAG: hypothetical protein AYK25_08205 [Thermoplasmatales archaeon SM1-50]